MKILKGKGLEKYQRGILKNYPESRIIFERGLFLAPASCIFCREQIRASMICEAAPEGHNWYCTKCGNVDDQERQALIYIELYERQQALLPPEQRDLPPLLTADDVPF